MSGQRLAGQLAVLLICAGWSGASQAQTRADVIPLGRSDASGAVCQAVRDYEDPVVQAKGRRAWSIRCRGWEASLGRLYSLSDAAGAAAWTQAFSDRADCTQLQTQALARLGATSLRTCRRGESTALYLAYEKRKGRALYVAEGASQIADILEGGLRVVSGEAKPPKAVEVQVSAASAEIAADFGGVSGGLARAQAAAAVDPARLRARGYVQNNEWRFDLAETDFQALAADAQTRHAPPREMGEALLNLALNVSNNARFAEADRLFDEAQAQVKAAQDPLLAAQALSYRALHLRNQGKFAEAVSAGRQALVAREGARQALGIAPGTPQVTAVAPGVIAIGPDLAQALNINAIGRGLLGAEPVSMAELLLVQDAQALEVIGSSLAAQGDAAGAREALNRANAIFVAIEGNGALNVWLRARVEADLAELDLDAGRAAQAADRLAASVEILRRRHAGSATEAGMLMTLGRAQAAAGREEAALSSYGRAFSVFQEQRGSLGASADEAASYFDLLLARIDKDPTHAEDYRARFFAAAESVVSNVTAQTVSKLAARVASGDGAITGLVRALDDTRRERRGTEARIATLEAQSGPENPERVALDARLKALQAQSDSLEQQLLAANPRYAQLVSSSSSLADLQKALGPDEVYVKIVLLHDRGYGILVSRGLAKPYAIDLTRDQAVAQVHALRAPFQAEDVLPEFDVARGYQLFQKMFGPVRAEVLAGRHLIYEPGGALMSLPVATLVTEDPAPVLARRPQGGEPDYRAISWLGARLESSLVLSASSFLQSRAFAPSRAKRSFLAFADPVTPRSGSRAFASVLRHSGLGSGGAGAAVCESTRQALMALSDLPDTADEVRKVNASLSGLGGDLVLGRAFTDDGIRTRTDLNDFKVLYFATHGLLPQPSGCMPEPALVTSLGEGESDGLLDTSEILDLKLDADLVVLSACDTGGGGGTATELTGLQGGDEALGGLTRAVIYAGARALIVSHWSVDSEATVRLMTGLFSSTGRSEAGALRQAQTALQSTSEWSHPYFWAPFTIIGDGARPLPGLSVN